MLVSVVRRRKNRKVTNLDNVAHEAIQWLRVLTNLLLTVNAVCGRAFSCRMHHLPAARNSRRQRRMLSCKLCSTTLWTSWFAVWPYGTNMLCITPLQSKKAINIVLVFVFEGRARVFFEAGEFVPRRSALCLLVCGAYYRHRVSSSAMMEQQNTSSLLAVSKGQHKFQNDPVFALHWDCALRVWHSVFSCQDPQLKFRGRPSCSCSSLTTFGR